MEIKLFELFSGIGAPRRSLELLGHDVVSLGYSEIDKNAINAYCELFDDIPDNNFGDITKIKRLPNDIDILFHGSPCQDFSVLGKQLGGERERESRSSLLWQTIRLLETTKNKPKMVIWENVKAVINKKHRPVFIDYLKTMEQFGYTNRVAKINPKDIGYPQSRTRIFVVSYLGNFKLKDSGLRFNVKLNDLVNFECFGDKGGKQFNYNIDKALKDNVGENDYIITENSKNFNGNKKKQIYKKYAPCCCARKSEMIKIHNKQGSYLLGKEKLALQGFPNIECLSETQKHKVAGNSINIPALMFLFKSINIKE